MKVTITVECSPEEARAFLGLPDLTPLHQQMLAEMEAAMKGRMAAAFDPAELVQGWIKAGMGGMEGLQAMLARLRAAGGGPGKG